MPAICIGICIGSSILAVWSQFAENWLNAHESSQAAEDNDTDTSDAVIKTADSALAFIRQSYTFLQSDAFAKSLDSCHRQESIKRSYCSRTSINTIEIV